MLITCEENTGVSHAGDNSSASQGPRLLGGALRWRKGGLCSNHMGSAVYTTHSPWAIIRALMRPAGKESVCFTWWNPGLTKHT